MQVYQGQLGILESKMIDNVMELDGYQSRRRRLTIGSFGEDTKAPVRPRSCSGCRFVNVVKLGIVVQADVDELVSKHLTDRFAKFKSAVKVVRTG
jgi:hypothetical protein